jgi:probable HAF family extracellular repeat protein
MSHAFRYDGMTTRDIAGTTLYSSGALGISDQGQVAGYYVYNAAGYRHAFLTAPYRDIDPSTDDLGTLGGSQAALSPATTPARRSALPLRWAMPHRRPGL